MVFFNYALRKLNAKIVYYGPALSGKTTNLEQIHRLTDPEGANRLISLNTAQDRTLFFDLLPFSLGKVSGYDFKIQLYTVPGQVQYNATRRVVLAGADAVVFVADSSEARFDANVESLYNLHENLKEYNLELGKIPFVMQWNKRDLPDALPVGVRADGAAQSSSRCRGRGQSGSGGSAVMPGSRRSRSWKSRAKAGQCRLLGQWIIM